MGRVYATPEQLATWTHRPAPEGAEQMLARASEDVEAALLTAVYAVDADGGPTEQHVVEALRDAVCAQVEWQVALGDDGTGAAGVWDSVSIGPVSMSGRKSGPPAASGVDLAPRAHRVLRRAGLLPGVIW
ncbi:hypothetical protein [Streptomyces sp. NPDC053048]|uniref:hypothetical protein n=1 Tax=Streptomyces sp. NPDC053048 TaxID=3365694 RepID=UPI0037D660E3